MARKGICVVKLDKVAFQGKLYKKAYNCFFVGNNGEFEHEHEPVVLLSPSDAEKDVYVVQKFDEIKTTYVAAAIYAFLHREGKQKDKIVIKHETGNIPFYLADTKNEVLCKLQQIDQLNFLRFF